jgi:hypothetical protein
VSQVKSLICPGEFGFRLQCSAPLVFRRDQWRYAISDGMAPLAVGRKIMPGNLDVVIVM